MHTPKSGKIRCRTPWKKLNCTLAHDLTYISVGVVVCFSGKLIFHFRREKKNGDRSDARRAQPQKIPATGKLRINPTLKWLLRRGSSGNGWHFGHLHLMGASGPVDFDTPHISSPLGYETGSCLIRFRDVEAQPLPHPFPSDKPHTCYLDLLRNESSLFKLTATFRPSRLFADST